MVGEPQDIQNVSGFDSRWCDTLGVRPWPRPHLLQQVNVKWWNPVAGTPENLSRRAVPGFNEPGRMLG